MSGERDTTLYVCSDCREPLKQRSIAEDDDGSDRVEFYCDDHGVRATIYGQTRLV